VLYSRNDMSNKILIIEDDKRIHAWIQTYLSKENFTVFSAFDGAQGLSLYQQHKPDLIVLDVMLPKINGFDLCERFRSNITTPIIMLTAQAEIQTRIRGLSLGAADYMVKPFDPAELVARIHAVLRRSQQKVENSLMLANINMNVSEQTVQVSGQPVKLSHIQFKLLWHFMKNPNQVLSREQLIKHIHSQGDDIFDRSIDNHIAKIRKLISIDGQQPIKTIYGAGYKFSVDK